MQILNISFSLFIITGAVFRQPLNLKMLIVKNSMHCCSLLRRKDISQHSFKSCADTLIAFSSRDIYKLNLYFKEYKILCMRLHSRDLLLPLLVFLENHVRVHTVISYYVFLNKLCFLLCLVNWREPRWRTVIHTKKEKGHIVLVS